MRTNAAFLARAAAHPDFVAGQVDTGFIARYADELVPAAEPSRAVLQAAAAALVPDVPAIRGPISPASVPMPPLTAGSRWRWPTSPISSSVAPPPPAAVADGVLFFGGEAWAFGPRRADHVAGGGASDGAVLAPMPGRVIAVLVAEGQAVAKGERLLVLEAMKMEQALLAPFDGVVAELKAREGAQVPESTLLARIEKTD